MTEVLDVMKAGYVSTTEVATYFGFQITTKFIWQRLSLKPALALRHGIYWSPEQVDEIRKALIAHLERLPPI